MSVNQAELGKIEPSKEQTLGEVLLSKVHKFRWSLSSKGDYRAYPKRYTLIVDTLDFVRFLDEMDELLEALIVPGMWAAIGKTLETKKEIKVQSVKQLAESL